MTNLINVVIEIALSSLFFDAQYLKYINSTKLKSYDKKYAIKFLHFLFRGFKLVKTFHTKATSRMKKDKDRDVQIKTGSNNHEENFALDVALNVTYQATSYCIKVKID